MQTTLLGLALALIAAIAAALAAPLFVDWNQWRPVFEDRATLLAGAPVRIRGPIEATILPIPAFVLRDVVIGDPDQSTGVRAGELRGNLSLGPLLRGVFEAEEFVLARPAMRLAIEPGGRMILPISASDPADADSFSISRIAVESGSLIIEDRASGGYLVFDNVSATGELRSRAGPLRLDVSLRLDDRRWTVRATTGRFGDDDAGKLRLLVERPDDGLSLDAEGTLTISRAQPHFAGKVTLARRGGRGLAWRMTANAAGNGERVALAELELAFGGGEAPVELAGNARFEPRRGGRIEGTLTARRIDLDSGLGGKAADGLLAALVPLRAALTPLENLELSGSIGVSIDGLIAGGGTARELRAELGLRQGAVALDGIEARLPGRASIRAAGTKTGREIFSGDVTLDAEEPVALARWVFGAATAVLPEDSGALQFGGRVELAPGRIAVDRFELALGIAKLAGRFLLADGERARRTRVESELKAEGFNLDLIVPILRVEAGSDALDFKLGIQGRDLTVFGRPVRRIDAVLSRSAEGVEVERLAIDDFDGFSAKARGRIAAPWERARGKIEFEVDAVRADGLAAVAQNLAGEDAAALVRRIAAGALPMKLTGAAAGDGSASGIAIEAAGRLAGLATHLSARMDPQTESLSDARLIVEAREAGRLVSLFGLSPGPPAPGDGRLEISIARPRERALPIKAELAVPGASLSGEGDIRLGAEGRIEPAIDLRLAAADLRPLLAAAAQAAGERELPASGSARITRAGEGIAFENIALTADGVQARGRLAVTGTEKPALAGKLMIERVEARSLLGLALGRAGQATLFWPAVRLGPPPLQNTSGSVELEVAALGLGGPPDAAGARFRVRLGGNEVAIEDFSADLAGGKLTGSARIARGDAIALDGRLALQEFDIARLIAPSAAQAPARGRGSLTLALAGNGRTPAALATSLAGQGQLALEAIEIDRLDPGAPGAVLAESRSGPPPDNNATLALIAPALEKAPLRLARLEAPVIVAAGIARAGKARARAGPVEVTAEGVLDLARLTLDATIELEAPAPEGIAARPGATVRWRGPLGAPERGIEAATLATAIALAAMERETQQLERRDRALPPAAGAPRPAAPLPPAVPPPRAATVPAGSEREPVVEPPTSALPLAGPPNVPLPPPRPRGTADPLRIMAPPR